MTRPSPSRIALVVIPLLCGAAVHAGEVPKDPVVAPRFPGSEMTSYDVKSDPDTNAILHVKDGQVGVQGHIVNIDYRISGDKEAHAAVLKHYRGLFAKDGGKVMFDGDLYGWRYVTAKFVDGIAETWVELRVGPPEEGKGVTASMTVVETLIESERPEQSVAQLESRLNRMTVLLARMEWEDSGAIKGSSVRHVRAIADFLKANPSWKLKLAVHSPEAKDKELVDKRAAAVRAYFERQGFGARVTVAGVIDAQPLFGSEKDPEGRRQNRALTLARAF